METPRKATPGKYIVKDIEVKGIILGVRPIQDRGRVQIPKIVRDKLRLNKEDSIYFVEWDKKIYITRAVKIT